MFDVLELVAPRTSGVPDLETLLTSVEYFGLTTASPTQRAVCRVLDGLPLRELAQDPDVQAALGGVDALKTLPSSRPKLFTLLCGIRSGKSLIAAACIVRAALTCDVSHLGPGEIPRAAIVSLTRDTAKPTWDHVYGRVLASPVLAKLVVGKPTADALVLRHPSGRHVEICVVAGAKAAGTLVARWLAGAIFDEAPRMNGAEEGVVNLDDQLTGIAGRLLPGAQVILSGSPWAPFGVCYNLLEQHFGKPSANVVVLRATGPMMNPSIWTPERCAELKLRDPDAYAVDVECQFLDQESGLFSLSDLEECRREHPMVGTAQDLHYYCAAIDPGFRSNSFTLIVLEKSRAGVLRVMLAKQWTGSQAQPLSPKLVFAEIAGLLAPYRITSVHSDEYAAEALTDIAADAGLWLVRHKTTQRSKLEQFTLLRALVADRMIEFPPDRQLVRDLASVRKRTTTTSVAIHLPQTADGRHADFAPAIALAVANPPANPDPEPQQDAKVGVTSPEALEQLEREQLAEVKERSRLAVQDQIRKKNKDLRRQFGF